MEHFTAAIAIDAGNHVFYSNRSAAYAGLQNFDAALADAEKTTEIKPDWSKGYSRKGAALYGLRRFDDAIAAYEAGLAIDPESEVLKSGLADVKSAAARANSGAGAADPMGSIGAMLSSPELYGKLATDPSTRGFLSQPDFIAMLTDVQKNPDKFGQYMNDPRMMKVLSVALGVNVMSGEEAAKGASPAARRTPRLPPRRPSLSRLLSPPRLPSPSPSPSPPVPRRRLRKRRSSATPHTRRRISTLPSRTTTRPSPWTTRTSPSSRTRRR